MTKLFLIYKKSSLLQKVLALLMFFQIIFLFFVNITQVKFHLGYDAASCFIKTNEIFKQGTLFIDNYGDQSGPFFDYVVPFAALLKNIFSDVFVAYGLVSFIVDICLITLLYKILRLCKCEITNIFIVLNLVICPFVPVTFNNGNDLSYINVLLVAPSYYSVRILIGVLVLFTYLKIKKSDSNKTPTFYKLDYCLFIISLIGLFIAGISSGYYLLITLLVPIFFYGVFEVFYTNTIKTCLKKENIYILCSIFVIFFGKFCNKYLLNFSVIDSNLKMISLGDFFANLQSILLGFLELLVGLPSFKNIRVVSESGIYYLVGLSIAVFLIFVLVKIIFENIKKPNYSLIFIFIIVINFLVYMLTNSRYGAQFFEIRYLVLPVLFLFCLIPFFLQTVDNSLLIKKFLLICMVTFTIFETFRSDYKFLTTKNDFSQMLKIERIANEYKKPIIYLYKDKVLARNMAAFDSTKYYRGIDFTDNGELILDFWGDYKFFSSKKEYNGEVLLYIPESMPDDISKFPINYKKNLIKITDRLYKSYFNLFAKDTYFDKTMSLFRDNLFSNNSTDDEGIRFIHPKGYSFGPYWNVPAGQYSVLIKGKNLSSAFFDVYHEKGAKHDTFTKNVTDSLVSLNLNLEEDVSDLEFFIRNDSESDIQLESLTIEKVKSITEIN